MAARSTESRELAQRLRRVRAGAELTQRQLADAMGSTRDVVAQVERGQPAGPDWWSSADVAVGARGALLAAYVDAERSRAEHAHRERLTRLATYARRADAMGAARPASEPADPIEAEPACVPIASNYIHSIHTRTRGLVHMDAQLGGDQIAEIACPVLRAVLRKVRHSPCPPALRRDLYAAAGELAEVTGWAVYDASRHDETQRVNATALRLSRKAGDRSMERLILQNQSMHLVDLGQHGPAVRIASAVLDSARLSPRLRCMFELRRARAWATAGAATDARAALAAARSLYLDGPRHDDPAWSWWINDAELSWHGAMVASASGDPVTAIARLHDSLDATATHRIRSRYHGVAALVEQQAAIGAHADLPATIAWVLPWVDEVRSSRTTARLHRALALLRGHVPPAVADAREQLRGALHAAGAGPPGYMAP